MKAKSNCYQTITGSDLSKEVFSLQFKNITVIELQHKSQIDRIYTEKTKIECKQGFVKVAARIQPSLKQHIGAVYSFDVYIPLNKLPPVILLNPSLNHVLVKLGTGRFFWPTSKWVACNTVCQAIQQSFRIFEEYFNLPVETQFEKLMKKDIYPANPMMWAMYKDNRNIELLACLQHNRKLEGKPM